MAEVVISNVIKTFGEVVALDEIYDSGTPPRRYEVVYTLADDLDEIFDGSTPPGDGLRSGDLAGSIRLAGSSGSPLRRARPGQSTGTGGAPV